ncbi:site-specific DNA-methyltransferase [Leptospira fluminis]|uniref:site-specific DNA-methyltransferase (adenine-specific) n=1 Tax=Leptospira fluminis TaxID=2484979 RepID=A0A4R9GM48_9LEPT|nr:site-specific DNA-methyltransferase [Leptospira fluminis]TGK15725.1 site-specific DNA-methyltransferase [Leptospira fluminis]
MANKKTKLELTWIGKDNRPRLEPRILLEDPEKSYHAKHRVAKNDIFDNRLIFGDNLLALKALEQEFTGKVKCIYIDPPYNTGSAFEHYDDGVEHSLWLSLMRDRLEILWRLLSDEGSIWISIDDNEMPYLRVLLDELCGRQAFIASNIWQKRYSRENREAIGDVHEYILVYAKNSNRFKDIRNKLPITEEQAKIYKNSNNDPKGRWRGIPMTAQGFRQNQMYEVITPTGVSHFPPEGRCWSTIESEFLRLKSEGRIWFGKDGNGQPNIIRYLSEVEGLVPWTWWESNEVGHTDEAKKEIHYLFGKVDAFDTPKPERLLERVIQIASNVGDLVLDSFAGSGTTGAVAHKMGRRWIMVELGEHCHTHIIPRLKKVIDGEDQGGISKTIDWKGGGGFRYYKLAPSLLEKDKWGNWIINKQYNSAMLAEAICKLEGFKYAPSDSVYWQHGYSTETDFIYVTTQALSRDQLSLLSQEVGNERTLLIICTAFRAQDSDFPNLTIKKIPNAVLSKCEWGHDDYSLQVENLPSAPKPEKSQLELFDFAEES